MSSPVHEEDPKSSSTGSKSFSGHPDRTEIGAQLRYLQQREMYYFTVRIRTEMGTTEVPSSSRPEEGGSQVEDKSDRKVEDVSDRLRFWRGLISPYNNFVSDADAVAWESLVMANFCDSLMKRAKEFGEARTVESMDGVRSGTPAMAFGFTIDNLRYGSLFFDVSILGIGPFLKFFFDKPELVMSFLDANVPRAFDDSLGLGAFLDHKEVAIYPSPKFGIALTNPNSVGDQPESLSLSPTKKVTWNDVVQKSSQIAWLLPTVLALAVLYVAMGMTSNEDERIHARETALDAEAKELRAANNARVEKLDALTLDLVKQLRAPNTGPAAASGTEAKINPMSR